MRHGSSMSSQSSELLHPKLQDALSSLDLNLEDELSRYRRQRVGLTAAPIVIRPKRKKKELDLMSFDAPPEGATPKAISFDISTGETAPDLSRFESEEFESEAAGEALIHIANGTSEDDEYLESSEHLLQSLEREEAKVQVERTFLEQLATPLGIGSMLTLLVSSAMFGYVVMNPSVLAGVGRLFSREEETVTVSPPDAPAPNGAAIPVSPPLDAQEFVDFGLNNFAVMQSRPPVIPPSSPSASPSPSPSPEAQTGGAAALMPPTPANSGNATPAAPSSAPVNNNSSAPQPAPRSSVMLPSVPVPQTRTPAIANPAPSVPARTLGYKIEVPFTGDQSLEKARQVVPDAFVRPDGKIQLGAVNSQAEAQKKVQDLKNQGIAAEARQR